MRICPVVQHLPQREEACDYDWVAAQEFDLSCHNEDT